MNKGLDFVLLTINLNMQGVAAMLVQCYFLRRIILCE
jgi:hypothetical protein